MGNGIDRREFLKGAVATAAVLLTADQLMAAEGAAEAPAVTGPAVKIGVIGIGPWGREVLTALSRLPSAQITAICDTYEPYVKKGLEIAPKAAMFSDFRKLL